MTLKMRVFLATAILVFTANAAQATVCGFNPNPCKGKEDECANFSDFVIDMQVGSMKEKTIPVPNPKTYEYDGDSGYEYKATRTYIGFKVTDWQKGKPKHDPTYIDYTIQGSAPCSGIETIEPEFEKGKKYRAYGVMHGSQNYCESTVMSENDLKYCDGKGPRMELRHYFLFEKLDN